MELLTLEAYQFKLVVDPLDVFIDLPMWIYKHRYATCPEIAVSAAQYLIATKLEPNNLNCEACLYLANCIYSSDPITVPKCIIDAAIDILIAVKGHLSCPSISTFINIFMSSHFSTEDIDLAHRVAFQIYRFYSHLEPVYISGDLYSHSPCILAEVIVYLFHIYRNKPFECIYFTSRTDLTLIAYNILDLINGDLGNVYDKIKTYPIKFRDRYEQRKNIIFPDIDIKRGDISISKLTRLGKGSYASVYRLDDKIAIKVMDISDPSTINDIAICCRLSDPSSRYVVTPFQIVLGMRAYYLMGTGFPVNSNSKHRVYETIESLKYIHNRQVIHNDIKFNNILVIDKRVCFIDFGISQIAEKRYKLVLPVYSIYSLPPEILLLKGSLLPDNYGKEIDIWALGCLIFNLLDMDHLFFLDNTIHFVLIMMLCFALETNQTIATSALETDIVRGTKILRARLKEMDPDTLEVMLYTLRIENRPNIDEVLAMTQNIYNL